MKKIVIPVALLLALIVGFGLGCIFEGFQAGKNIGAQMYGPLFQSRDTALEAYKMADPIIAIWVLQRHLAHIDKFEQDGFPTPEDLLPERFSTHARLAKLYGTQGNVELESKEVELALATGFMHLTNKNELYNALSMFDSRQSP